MALYLLHFDRPYKHARHYLGYAKTEAGIEARIQKHRAGRGARLIRVILEAGIDFTLARTWPEGDRKLEYQLKRKRGAPGMCPICLGVSRIGSNKT